MLESLREMAFDTAEESRSHLLHLLTRQVFVGRTPNGQEIAIFSDIAQRLLPQAKVDVRAELSEALADQAGLPMPLIASLCSDVVVVAAPMLRRCPDLTEDDLATFAERLTNAHLVAIAGRTDLTVRITDVMIRRGEVTVLRAIAENTAAEISETSAHVMVDRAESDDELCRILALRGDLPAADAERLVMLVAKRLRGRMMQRPAAPEPVAPAPAAPAPVAGGGPVKPLDIADLIARVRRNETDIDTAVALLAREDRYNDLAHMLAVLTDIEELSVLKVLVRADANGIINVLRALGVADQTWRLVVELRRRRLKFSDTQARFEREDFARLSVAQAKKTLAQFTRRRQAG